MLHQQNDFLCQICWPKQCTGKGTQQKYRVANLHIQFPKERAEETTTYIVLFDFSGFLVGAPSLVMTPCRQCCLFLLLWLTGRLFCGEAWKHDFILCRFCASLRVCLHQRGGEHFSNAVGCVAMHCCLHRVSCVFRCIFETFDIIPIVTRTCWP